MIFQEHSILHTRLHPRAKIRWVYRGFYGASTLLFFEHKSIELCQIEISTF